MQWGTFLQDQVNCVLIRAQMTTPTEMDALSVFFFNLERKMFHLRCPSGSDFGSSGDEEDDYGLLLRPLW